MAPGHSFEIDEKMSAPVRRVVAAAPPNLALVKYWGKRDAARNLPLADSFSLGLDRFPTRVCVERRPRGEEDGFDFDGIPASGDARHRFGRILAEVRGSAGESFPVAVSVSPGLPPRVGLAGSAATMAAFGAAVLRLHGLAWPRPRLSALARLGSGSAARAVPGGFVRWACGVREDGADSYASTLFPAAHWPDLKVLLVILDTTPKRVSSGKGMERTAATAPGFSAWVQSCRADVEVVQEAVRRLDFHALVEVMERNTLAMHQLCGRAVPELVYLTDQSRAVMALVRELRGRFRVGFTFDAGPNAILLTVNQDLGAVKRAVGREFPHADIRAAGVGGGVMVEAVGEEHL